MKVLILGLGQYPQGSGVEAAVFFAERGDEVIVTDLKTKKELLGNVRRLAKYAKLSFVLGEHRLEDVRAADVVVPNPRVRPDNPCLQEAVRLGKTIESDISLFLLACPAPTIGVTGTRGKSTTTTLIAEMLKADGRHVWLGGNILVSPLAFLSKVKASHWVVLELSSWQLELTGRKGVSPDYAVWTNLMRDHLNTYGSLEEYAEAKAQIFRHQQPEGVVFLPAARSFDVYAESAPGEVVRVGGLRDEARRLVKAVDMKISGQHNFDNAMSATAVASRLGVRDVTIKKVLQTFPGLPHRQEEIAVIRGVRYVNDTTATTPDATMAALEAIGQKSMVHLIFGGADKELEFMEVAGMIKRLGVKVYLLPGTAHDKIVASFEQIGITWHEAKDLQRAMRHIQTLVVPGDVVLLSPGCASFGLFKNEFHRAEVFAKIVGRLRRV